MRELAKELVQTERKLGHTHSDSDYATLLTDLIKEERAKAIRERSSPPPEHTRNWELHTSPAKGENSTRGDELKLGRSVGGGLKPVFDRTTPKLPKLTHLVEWVDATESELENAHAAATPQLFLGMSGQTATPRKLSGHVKDRVDLFEAKTPSPNAKTPSPRARTPSPPKMCCHADVHNVPFEGLALPALWAAREGDDDEWFPAPGSWRDV
ncbi:hypothetical protein HBI56_201560 [Parastagonospora nodorum]|uniref:Uncharacterized protein n=1 Tax=Phaeosphaeria nodorum (strain SN15 / ATCC MYA-4574 / FGSC 10173) TaxID=321614 RepID=A0A7U2EZL4_PHANO|nr:hypothetical protein HBH56_216090 [Parastagonospora nodorum]QRC93905.1 hypothetical protein JI435_155960 [Parastagonospora nodorum SN15]KAH3922690.1 hypothetical protein HBH54_221420 [Parastagonospora nodorum]KAH3942080.1 hypothetical protein HBH53_191330 [Parastagonospora nodorum]KAH3961396.1 hypothetical protein HBH51_184770 [Parastagonospora nodorum]